MNLTLRIFILILLFTFLVLIIKKVNQKGISVRYASLWIVVILLLMLVDLFPNVILHLASLLGFETASNMFFLLGFFVLAYMVFSITIALSKQNEKIKTLIQELSLLKDNDKGKRE